jgi:dethiobiotin synthetase
LEEPLIGNKSGNVGVTHRKLVTLFFAGTDTEVGKTYVASLVARRLVTSGHRVGVYKPVASGCTDRDGALFSEDAFELWQAAGCPRSLDDVCPQRFRQPLAPPQAAVAEGRRADFQQMRRGALTWQSGFDVSIIEGAGGLFSPLADGALNLDLAKELDCTVIVVAANRLGVIHQVLSTCNAAIHAGIRPRGIFLSSPTDRRDESVASNAEQIVRYCDVPILGVIPFGGGTESVAGIDTIVSDP